MMRLSIIIALLASLVFLIKAGFETGRGEKPSEPETSAKPASVSIPAQEEPRFYPQTPDHIPDLSEGYLFNAERLLENAEVPAQDDQHEDDSIMVDLEDVTYVGSVITSQLRKGIISYPAPSEKQQLPKKRTLPSGKPERASAPNLNLSYAHLVTGDKFSGYKVADVSPEKIVFEKGGETFEKRLFDPEKKRITPPVIAKKAPNADRPHPADNGSLRNRKVAQLPQTEREKSDQNQGRISRAMTRRPSRPVPPPLPNNRDYEPENPEVSDTEVPSEPEGNEPVEPGLPEPLEPSEQLE